MTDQKEIILNSYQDLIYKEFGNNPDGIENLKADASERTLYRIKINSKSVIGVYNENKKENEAFINFTKSFIELGFNVPEILRVSEDHLFYLEEDLGDTTLFSLLSSDPAELHSGYYKQALTDLARFQFEAKDKLDFNYCYQTKEFNIKVIESDLNRFFNYFSKTNYGINIDRKILQNIIEYSEEILRSVRSDFFMYRDFQPRNIMVKENMFYYIDYQSGRKGPLQYDPASFLYSGSININQTEREVLLDFYINEMNKYIKLSRDEFMEHFYFFVFIRLLQIVGSYSLLFTKRNDKFALNKIPAALEKLKNLKGKTGSKIIDNCIAVLTA